MNRPGMNFLRILEIIGGVLVVLWILGLVLRIISPLIHLLLLAAIVVFIVRFIQRETGPRQS